MKRVLLLVASAVALTGCASYNASSLGSLSGAYAAPQKEDLIVVAKAFDRTDCQRFFDRDILAKGYQPIQLYIQNNSDKSYAFSLSRVSLSCARPEEVAQKVHTSTVGRAVGYGAGALILWPLAIPAVIDGMGSASANDSLDNDFAAKSARDQTIAPHAYFNKVIFVSVAEYQPVFAVTLLEEQTRTPKTFDVTAGY